MAMRANELRPGMAVNLDGKLYVVIKTEHTKPGKGPAYVQAKMRGVDGSGTAEKRFNSDATVEGATLDRREMEYLYSDASGATFMDLEDYDQVILPEELLGDALLYLKPNSSCITLCHEGKPVSLELPASVELTVTDTPPGIKGATATNQLKEATLETGLKTRVPPFITNGEMIKVSTEDGSYLSRAKGE
ncbi:MAG: elongation factor P [Phycisphaerales bacterium]